ncbi:MAG: hypothetical protein HC822_09455 [Oscillochloris sp.]|nr:hypothetical protein [Oscillochloris sp.]
MTTSPALLKQILAAHGDSLYRTALLLVGNERDAGRLLQRFITDLVAAWGVAPPATPPDEPSLLAALIAIVRGEQAKRSQQRRPLPNNLPPLYRSVLGLPLEQRAAIALMLINGYDLQRMALALAQDEAAVRTTLITAMRALAPATGQSITDRVSADLCHEVRAALVDPAGRCAIVRRCAAILPGAPPAAPSISVGAR